MAPPAIAMELHRGHQVSSRPIAKRPSATKGKLGKRTSLVRVAPYEKRIKELVKVPFCIMTLRQEQYPPPPYGLLVLSMASRGPMSGTYCRPCDKESNATMSKFIVEQCMRDWDWPGVSGNAVTVCDGSLPWASSWREIAGPMDEKDAGDRQGIRSFEKRGFQNCVQEMRAFQEGWDVWNSPPVEVHL